MNKINITLGYRNFFQAIFFQKTLNQPQTFEQ